MSSKTTSRKLNAKEPVRSTGGYAIVNGGAYAAGKRDPREMTPNELKPKLDGRVRSSEIVRLRKLKARLAAYMRWDKTDCNISTRARRHCWMAKDAAEIARLTRPNDPSSPTAPAETVERKKDAL